MLQLRFTNNLLLLLCILLGLQGNAFAKHLKSNSKHKPLISHSVHNRDSHHSSQLHKKEVSRDCAGLGKCLLNAQPSMASDEKANVLFAMVHQMADKPLLDYQSVLHTPPKPPPKS